MKNGAQAAAAGYRYQAPTIYVGLFYGALVLWTLVSILLLGPKVAGPGWEDGFQFFSIAFIMAMTWYFSTGVCHRVHMEEDGTIQLTSLRRILRTSPRDIMLIEGPRLPVGFLRFRLQGERVYLFCVLKKKELQEILLAIRTANPELRVKNVGILNLTR